MATMIIDCSSCGRKLRVPDELLGKAVKCPTCEHIFQAPMAPAQAPPSAVLPAPEPVFPPAEALHLSSTPGSSEGPETPHADDMLRRCPSCGEQLDKHAARCRVCGAELKHAEAEADRPWEQARHVGPRRDAEPHRGTLILVLGIISLVMMGCGIISLPLGIAAWVMGRRDLAKMRQQMMDREGEGLTQAGWICGIIGTVLGSLSFLACFLYFALIFTFAAAARRPMPPALPVPVPAPVRPAPGAAPAPADDKAAERFITQRRMTG